MLCDAYLARAGWLMRSMMPHAVLFLGDLMDGGAQHSDAEYDRSVRRLGRVLSPPPLSAVMHVAGNHDTGNRVKRQLTVCRLSPERVATVL